MDFGFVFMGDVHIHGDVKYAEDHGFSHAWIYDTQMLGSEVYAALALCADRTSRIKLGPGVTNPASRIAPLSACGMATINSLAPGRAIMGIGTGNTTRRTMGMPAAKVSELEEHVRICRDLFDGKITDYSEGERHRKIKFLNPDLGYINIKDYIPIYVSASGPKVAQLAGRVADGVILFGAVHPELVKWMVGNVRKGAEEAGRNPDDIYVLSMTAFHLTESDEQIETREVREAVGPMVASSSNIFALSCHKDPSVMPGELREELMKFVGVYREPDAPIETRHLKLYEGYLQHLKNEHEALMSKKIIQATTLTGTKKEVIGMIEAMRDAGVHQVAIQPIRPSREVVDQVAKEIMPAFA
ncbi:MAG: LLM class flavin-dependent oxidoreductase [Gammaproteobacteria bacterium]